MIDLVYRNGLAAGTFAEIFDLGQVFEMVRGKLIKDNNIAVENATFAYAVNIFGLVKRPHALRALAFDEPRKQEGGLASAGQAEQEEDGGIDLDALLILFTRSMSLEVDHIHNFGVIGD